MAWFAQQGPANNEGFAGLFNNHYGFVAIEKFLTCEQAEQMVVALRSAGMKSYDYSFDNDAAPPAGHLFTTHYLYEQKQVPDYLPDAENSIKQYRAMIENLDFDVAEKVMQIVQQAFPKSRVMLATQEGEAYSYIMARELNHSALLHADFAAFLPKRWSISDVIAQYAWNVYLTDPGEGGEAIVYNKPWQPSDDDYIVGETYGYDHEVVKECESVIIKPNVGMLAFFNCRNFHEVTKSTAPRLSLGGHAGRLANGDIIFWV